MPRSAPFEAHHQRYDTWFERHAVAYYSELLAVRALLPWDGLGLAIGVGTGRFAAPLGVTVGLEPATAPLAYATARGITGIQGVAEALPFAANAFDFALSVTTLCFVDDAGAMLAEARRVLKPDGALVLGFVDRDSRLGQHYLEHQAENVFYRDATFFSATEVETLLAETGFTDTTWVQTLSRSLEETRQLEPLRAGRGTGAFVAVRARAHPE